MKRIGGFRRKTRDKIKKKYQNKGKISITNYFQTFDIGENVNLYCEPAVQNGMYHPRFYGGNGIVLGKRGKCYVVELKDGNVKKKLIVHPVHLQKI